MDAPRAKEPRHFWASATAIKVIRDALGNPDWEPKSGQEAWETLRDEIVALNSKGRFKPVDAPKYVANGAEIYLLVDGQPLPEKEDWLAMKPELIRHLRVLALLLQRLRRRLISRLGKHKGMTLHKLARRLQAPGTRTFFELACTIGSLDTVYGIRTLEKVGREGVHWTLPGGIEGGCRDRDCGIEPLVMATRYAQGMLAKKQASPTRTDPPTRKRKVRVKRLPAMRFALKAKGVPAILISGKYGILFCLLYDAYESKKKDHGGWVSYEMCDDHIYAVRTDERSRDSSQDRKQTHSRSSRNEGGGKAQDRLRTLKSGLEKKLRTAFGPVSAGGEQSWIENDTGRAYRLNSSGVIWDHSRKRTSSRKVEREE